MPRLPIDYSKTIIYKICCNDLNIKEIYVGHTTDLIRRRKHHKENCIYEKSKQYNQYKYQFIRENGGFDNWSLVPVEEFSCENVNQARIRERYWIETLQASLNRNIPSRSQKERYEINKEVICEKAKQRYESNKEEINERNKKYRENNKEKIAEKDKQKYESNKEKYAEKSKQRYERNKEKIAEKGKVKITCDCGSICRISDKSRHLKSKKHQEYLSCVYIDRQESTS